MSYVKIQVKKMGKTEDLQLWEDHMQEKSKCWNKFCLGIYGKNELHAVHVIKEDNPGMLCLTTLCEDCIENMTAREVLVNDNHLMIE